jgi:phosphomannomutase/phosphoglucomutase
MRRLIEEGENVLFGGEGNGGLIFPAHQFCRDGAMTVATMVHMLASTQSSLSAEIGKLPQYTMIKDKIHTRRAAEILGRIEDAYRDESIDRTDGLKVSLGDAWALVRASGTEPLVRIMVESSDKKAAESLYSDISRRISDLTG